MVCVQTKDDITWKHENGVSRVGEGWEIHGVKVAQAVIPRLALYLQKNYQKLWIFPLNMCKRPG